MVENLTYKLSENCEKALCSVNGELPCGEATEWLPKGKEQQRWSSALPFDWNAGVTSGTVRLPTFTKHTKRSRAATCTGDYGTEVAAYAPEDLL